MTPAIFFCYAMLFFPRKGAWKLLGILLFGIVLTGTAEPNPSAPGKKRKPKEVCGGGHYNTRAWMKNSFEAAQTAEDRKHLAAAIILVYNGGTYDDAEALTYGWTSHFVKLQVLNRMPKGLVQDEHRRQLERAAGNVAGFKHKGCWTHFEFKELMFKFLTQPGTGGGRGLQLFESYGVSKSNFYEVLYKSTLNKDSAKTMGRAALLSAIDKVEMPPRGHPPSLSLSLSLSHTHSLTLSRAAFRSEKRQREDGCSI